MKKITLLKQIKTQIVFFVTVIFLFISMFEESARAQIKVLDYGFEDWTGDAETTPEYPFTNSDQIYWDIHTACTEVVTSYNADEMNQIWISHTGNNYLMLDRSATTELEPTVSGISAISVNSRCNLGVGLSFGGLNKINFVNTITTGKVFIRFWARFNKGHYGKFSGNPYPGMKFIRIHNDDLESTADIFMSLNCNHDINPLMYLWQTSSGGSHGSITIPNAYNGNWHKFSMYVDFNNGIVKQWYDVNIETLDNANQTWDNNGQIGAATHVTYISLNGNFAANYPLEEIYSAVDNIEVWDGMPEITDITPQTDFKQYNFVLRQNYPNPFNSSTTIKYSVIKSCNVQIKIYTQLGQEIRMLVNEQKPGGEHNITWDGKDAKGNELISGVYFYQLTDGNNAFTRKILYLR